MHTVRAGPRQARRGGCSRPRRRPLIYGLGNQQKGAKARLENWLFNLFTFDIQPPPQALILASAPAHPAPRPTKGALCAPRHPARGSALRSRPRGPGTTYHNPAPRRGEAQAPALGVFAFVVRCTLPAHTSEAGERVERPRSPFAQGASLLATFSPTLGHFPHSCAWSSTPFGPDGVEWELYFPRRGAPVSLEAKKR